MKGPIRIHVNSRDPDLSCLLRELDNRSDIYEITSSCGTGAVVEAVLDQGPDILVMDVEQEDRSTPASVRLLRKLRPDLRIIVLVADSTLQDAEIVEQGIFYYTTKPAQGELAPVVEAAVRDLANRWGKRVR